MLKQRIITAIVLLCLLIPAIFYTTPWPFCFIALIAITAATWEWGRLNGCTPITAIILAGVCAASCAAYWAAGILDMAQPWLMRVGGLLWVLGGASLLWGGVDFWQRIPRSVRLVGGMLALGLAWLAVAQARILGINFLLSVFLLVWVADIAAYFSGRAFGLRFTKRKLAPSLSPGKSWEGVWGGISGILVLACIWVKIDAQWAIASPSFFSRIVSQGGWGLLAIAIIFMGMMSVVGDLVESLVKRAAGMKDSSGLLPGHGGVLDRVDSLLPTLPLALMLLQV